MNNGNKYGIDSSIIDAFDGNLRKVKEYLIGKFGEEIADMIYKILTNTHQISTTKE